MSARARRGAAAAVLAAAAPPGPSSRRVRPRAAGKTDLPLPTWLFSWAAAIVLIASFAALAALWPKPELQEEHRRRMAGCRSGWTSQPARSESRCSRSSSTPGSPGSQDAHRQSGDGVRVRPFLGRDGRRERAARRCLPVLQPLAGARPRERVGVRAAARASLDAAALISGAGSGAGRRCWGSSGSAGSSLLPGQDAPEHRGRARGVAYAVVQLVGMTAYGAETWSRRGDAFGVYFEL